MREEIITAEEDGVRLDRWFRRRHPQITQGELQRWLRKKLVRLNGGRCEGNTRLAVGDILRLPPIEETTTPPRPAADPALVNTLRQSVLYEDDALLALNKPAGLAVQGGSGIRHSVDDGLAALAEGGRLTHRLDRDTSGVLLIAKTAPAAAALTAAFRQKTIRKTYLTLVVGVPSPVAGIIDAPLLKRREGGMERMAVDPQGQPARSHYQMLDNAGKTAALLALEPETGRTHQLRVHCAHLGHPIFGDPKYGDPEREEPLQALGLNGGLHLHAARLAFAHPSTGADITITAPLPALMRENLSLLGMEPPKLASMR